MIELIFCHEACPDWTILGYRGEYRDCGCKPGPPLRDSSLQKTTDKALYERDDRSSCLIPLRADNAYATLTSSCPLAHPLHIPRIPRRTTPLAPAALSRVVPTGRTHLAACCRGLRAARGPRGTPPTWLRMIGWGRGCARGGGLA